MISFLSSVYLHHGFGSSPSINRVTEIKTSRTHGSCLVLLLRQRVSWSFTGSFPLRCSGFKMPMNLRSWAIAGPMFGKSVRLRTLLRSTFAGFMDASFTRFKGKGPICYASCLTTHSLLLTRFQYFTSFRNNPRAGAVGPASFRSFESRILLNS